MTLVAKVKKANVNGKLPATSLEEINERWREKHSVRRVRKGRTSKEKQQESDAVDLAGGSIPVWSEAKSLKQDYRCKCRDTIKKGAWHVLNIETDQRLCIVCALEMGLPRSLFWHYWRDKR